MEWAFAVVGCFVGLVGVIACCGKVFDSESSPQRAEALHAPLLRKDAQSGFNKCIFCGFENFKRIPFCNLCGKEIDAKGSGGVVAAAPTARELSNCTQRQKRARSRKEWVRKIDVKGKLFWYRHGGGRRTRRYPGYTLTFVVDTDAALPEISVEIAASIDIPPTTNPSETAATPRPKVTIEIIPPDTTTLSPRVDLEMPPTTETQENDPELPSPLAKAVVIQSLHLETAFQTLVLTESSVANPAGNPLDDEARAQTPWTHTLQMASRDFPTKYAHFVTQTTDLIVQVTKQYIKLNIRRDDLLEDSMESLGSIPPDHIHSVIRVEFADERGVDAGGLQREWFLQLNLALAEPSSGVLRCVNAAEQMLYLNPNSRHDIGDDHLLYYYATGRLIGRALLEGQVLGFHLALPLIKITLGLPILFTDLEYFDPEAYKSLVWITNNEGVGDLGIDFSITEKRGDEMVVIDLIEGGRDIDVTDENKDLYLERRFRYLLFESVSSQLYAFLKGVYEVIPFELLALFDPEEFDYVLCGSDDIDVDEWERCTRVSASLQKHEKAVRWFWELVREMPNEYRRRLLHFATGSSRVPLGGFSALTSTDGRLCPFTLKGVKLEGNEYIASRACFNRLDIPLYTSRTQMKAMLFGILETELHGFTRD